MIDVPRLQARVRELMRDGLMFGEASVEAHAEQGHTVKLGKHPSHVLMQTHRPTRSGYAPEDRSSIMSRRQWKQRRRA